MKMEKSGKYRAHKYWVMDNPMGFRCGYVETYLSYHPERLVFPHGGVTYISTCLPDHSYESDGGTILGFDCGHWGDGFDYDLLPDKKPNEFHIMVNKTDTIWTAEMVEDECHRMIDDLIRAAWDGHDPDEEEDDI